MDNIRNGCNKKSYRTILEKAKERQLEGKPSVKLTEGGNSSDKVAGFVVGVSRNTLKKAEEIVNAAEEERTRKISKEIWFNKRN